MVAARGHWDRATVMMALVGLAGVGAWASVWLPLLVGWWPAGDRMRQARRVERLQPGLRGHLLTAVERAAGPRSGESGALVGLVARRAASAIQGLAVQRVHPGGHILRVAVVAFLSWLIALPAMWMAPGGPGGAGADVVAGAAVVTAQN